MTLPEKRKGGIRRDVNGLVRGKDGEISGSKIATYIAQYIAAKMLLALVSPLPGWDTLAVLFTVLLAPEAYKQMMAMKWGGAIQGRTERTERSQSSSTVTTTPAKKVDNPDDK